MASPVQDEGFRQYLVEGAPYLQHMLPISKSASRLLSRIFDPSPSTRISLSDLRKATQAVDTFFAPTHPLCTPLVDPYQHLFDKVLPIDNTDANRMLSRRPTIEFNVPSASAVMDVHISTLPLPSSSDPAPPPLDAPSSRRSTSGSGTDSGGPITPPSTTQNPTMLSSEDDIPEISLADADVDANSDSSSSSSSSSSCLSSASMDVQPSSMAGRAPGRAALRGNRKRVFAGIGLGIGSLGSGTGSGLSRKLRQYRIGESAQRFVGVMRELKLRA